MENSNLEVFELVIGASWGFLVGLDRSIRSLTCKVSKPRTSGKEASHRGAKPQAKPGLAKP